MEASILPFCFRLQGSGGFLHQLGKSFAMLHQMDCIHMDRHAEHSSLSFKLEKILDQVLCKYSPSLLCPAYKNGELIFISRLVC